MKKILTLLILIFVLFSCTIQNNNTDKIEIKTKNTVGEQKLKITTSIIPLASIANYIGGDYAEAKALVPAGVSPHTFGLKPNQMVDINKSDLIVYLGLEHIDGFLNKAIEGKNNVIIAKEGVEFIKGGHHHHDEDEHHEEHEDAEHHEEEEGHEMNPHIWSNIHNASIIAKHISSELTKKDPKHKEYFEKNLTSFKTNLDSLKNDFLKNTKDKNQVNFIVFHDAYGYLFKELGVNETKKHIFRANVVSDPNSAQMKELIDDIKKENIKVAFREPQLNSSNLEKLASEYNLKIFVLDPLGEDETKNGYIKNYANNLKSLENIYE